MNKQQLEVEYKELKDRYERIHMLVRQLFAEENGMPFICGIMGKKDKNGMPEYFSICATYGSDAVYTYKKV